jgi:hypothetical protein
MSYFSSKSTWLSLVDAGGSSRPFANQAIPDSGLSPSLDPTAGDILHSLDLKASEVQSSMLDGISLSFEDYRPCYPAHEDNALTEDPVSLSAEELDYMKITRDLRHRLFFHFKEWEFGPALLEDHIHLAQAESNPEEALVHYCHARHVAVTLVKRNNQPTYILALLEADRIIAEIHNLIGNHESCALYAKEGLDTIKKNKFSAGLDMRITKLTVGFFHLLTRPS